jgi:hypothetical protein
MPAGNLAAMNPAAQGMNALGVATGSKTYAGDTYAALTRDMWNSYVQNFMPYENKLIEYAQSPTVVSDAMSEASGLVEQSFAQQQGATQRRLKGLGLTLDADEQKAVDRSYGMAKSLADVTAQNVAGQQTRERQQSVLGHPAPMPG